MSSTAIKKARLIIRNATLKDVPGICRLDKAVYPDWLPWDMACINSQITRYPEGQFIALFDNEVVGYSASIRVSGAIALCQHTWEDITGNGFATTHDPHGDYLYGMETFIDPRFWNKHIGHRIYNERKELCVRSHLKGIVACGRMSHFSEEKKRVKTPEKYIELVQNEKIHDHTLLFQLHNGFEIIGILKNYLKEDKKSLGYGAHLLWHNPELLHVHQSNELHQHRAKHHYLDQDHVRVATVQYEQRKISSYDEFANHVEYFVRSVAEYRTDFVLFPESFTMQLLSMHHEPLTADKAIETLAKYTEQFKDMMMKLAIEYNINIIGGSIPTKKGTEIQNVAYVFLRDGSVHAQAKVHPTPDERNVWNMQGTSKVERIMTDCGPIGVLICYDAEFPELSRHLVDQGMFILFVPFCTDQRAGYLRVRYCAQARAVENQCYVAIAGNVGNLPGVSNMNVQYAQSAIFTPSDFSFARDGIAAETPINVETIAFADLNIKTLIAARNSGSVINLQDRRTDLYTVEWKGKVKK